MCITKLICNTLIADAVISKGHVIVFIQLLVHLLEKLYKFLILIKFIYNFFYNI